MSTDLFGTYLNYSFPKPQYLGAKYIHRGWISQFIPKSAKTVLDAFGGSQSIAFAMKQLGKKTLTNDFLCFNHQIGKALIENKDTILDEDDVKVLTSSNSSPKEYNLMEQLFTDLFFTHEETMFLDAYRSNIQFLENEYKRSLAFTIMCRSMTRKVTMGHFAHTQALNYASSPERIKRNRSLIKPIKDIFTELLPQYNAAVFDNHEDNASYNENILELLPCLNDVDFIYFDPPYCNSHADYQSFYHLLETFVVYWKDKQFVNGTKRYEPKRHSGFDKNAESIDNLKKLFSYAEKVPYWLVSYNDRSFPDINVMMDMMLPYKKVKIERKTYSAGRGGKGSVAGSSEILFVCTPL